MATYDILYDGTGLEVPGSRTSGNGYTDIALLGTAGGWNYDSCRYDVNYGGDPTGSAVQSGNGICYTTSGGHTALIVIDSVSDSSITMDVEVYE